MANEFDSIENALGLSPDNVVVPQKAILIKSELPPIKDEKLESDLHADYNAVRKNLRELVEVGKGALDGVLAVALEGDSPRAYEVVAQMIKSLSDANQEIMNLHEKIKIIRKETTINKISNTTNSIYVGSTKELQDIINTARSSTKAFDNRPDILETIQNQKDNTDDE